METIFIGSSQQSVKYAEAVQDYFIKHHYKVKLWTDIAIPGDILISRLRDQISECDFSIFVFAMDDKLISKNDEYSVVRDNVILELGMSIGILGVNRSYILREEANEQQTKILADLGGVIYAKYRKPEEDDITSIQESVRQACREIHHGIDTIVKQRKPNVKKQIVYELINGTLHSICRAAGMPKSANQFRAFYFEKYSSQLICKCHWSLNPVVNQEDKLIFDLNTKDLPSIAVVRSGLGSTKLEFDDIDPSVQAELAKKKPVSKKLKYVISKVVISEKHEVLGVISIDTDSLSGKTILLTKNHELADYMITNTCNLLSKLYQL